MLLTFNPTASTLGVPIKLLHEAEGHVVTVELKNGETYRGVLTDTEDTMNCQMKEGEICAHILCPPIQ
jgi:small nuclear ribonucleoprotein D3